MTSKTWSRKFIAISVAVAVLSVYSMAVLARRGPKHLVNCRFRDKLVVNGQKVISGGTHSQIRHQHRRSEQRLTLALKIGPKGAFTKQ
jgi:hypothetical protein